MSRFFPHTTYAEDQPLSTTILTTHVLHRAFQSGVTIGLIAETLRPIVRPGGGSRHFLLASGRGGVIGTSLMAVGLPLYMWGQTDIQWRDRSWRLLENPGQLETDDWCILGSVVGAGLAAARVGSTATGGAKAMKIVGGAGIGNMAGVLGYMIWRYGVRGGKFE